MTRVTSTLNAGHCTVAGVVARTSAIHPSRGIAFAICAAVFASAFLIAFQATTRATGRSTAVFMMLACSAALNGALLLPRWRQPMRCPNRAWFTSVFALAAMTIVGNWSAAAALSHLDAGVASTVIQSQIFFVGIGARLFLGEPTTGRFVVGATLAVAGFAILGIPTPGAQTISSIGIGHAVFAALAFGGMLVWTRAVITYIDPVSVNAGRLIVATLVLACVPGNIAASLSVSASTWLFAGAAAACGPVASRLCLMYAVRDISASRTKLLSLLSPIFAFGFAYAIYGTYPLLREFAGGVLILLGVLIPSIWQSRNTRRNRRLRADAFAPPAQR